MAQVIGLGKPLIPRPGILPMRVMPRLIPRLMTYATRVRVHRGAYGEEPAADLIPKLISSSTDKDGIFHEYYVLFFDGNPEAFMDLATGPVEIHPEFETNIGCEISRCGFAAFDIYLDETLMVSWPEITAETPKPYVGYVSFWIPIK